MWELAVEGVHNFAVHTGSFDLLVYNNGEEFTLPDGFTGRLDEFNVGDGVDFEIHVFDRNGNEVGIFGSQAPNRWKRRLSMKYVLVEKTERGSYLDPQPYLTELANLAAQLPPGAAAFATNSDHYDFHSERCVKDLKLRSVNYLDTRDSIDIRLDFQFNDLNQAPELSVLYTDVRVFDLRVLDKNPMGPTRLGDLKLDEILPVDGRVSHEFAFFGGTLMVHCEDLVATWTQP